MSAILAFTVPKPDAEAVIVYQGVSWPIASEGLAYQLAKKCGLPGFWRLKSRQLDEVKK